MKGYKHMDYSRFNIHGFEDPYRNTTPSIDYTDKIPPREAHEEIHDLLAAMNDFLHTYGDCYPEDLSLETMQSFEQACLKITEVMKTEEQSMSLPQELRKALIALSDAAGKMLYYFWEKFCKYFPDDLDKYTPGDYKEK